MADLSAQLSPYMSPDSVRTLIQAQLNQMPWDGSGPIDSLANTTDWFIRSFGVNTGVSAQEIAGMIADAYHYNGVPESGYSGPEVLGATDDNTTSYTGGGTTSGYTADQITQLNTQHKENLRQIKQAYESGLLNYNEQMAALEDARNNLITQKDQGLESNNAYFSNVSPDAFQSQIGNYNTKVLDAYNQGEKTLENNQKSIDYAKDVNRQNYEAQLAGENTFNEGTGMYSGAYKFAAPTVKAPTINAVTQNPSAQAAKLGVPSWAPNYGGMSVSKAKAKDEDSINKYLG